MPDELNCRDCRRLGPDHPGVHQANGAAIINGERVRWVTVWHRDAGRVRQFEAEHLAVSHA